MWFAWRGETDAEFEYDWSFLGTSLDMVLGRTNAFYYIAQMFGPRPWWQSCIMCLVVCASITAFDGVRLRLIRFAKG